MEKYHLEDGVKIKNEDINYAQREEFYAAESILSPFLRTPFQLTPSDFYDTHTYLT